MRPSRQRCSRSARQISWPCWPARIRRPSASNAASPRCSPHATASSSGTLPPRLAATWSTFRVRMRPGRLPSWSTAVRPTANTFAAWRLSTTSTSPRCARCPPRRTLLAEGVPSTACYLTINGAVEKVLIRPDGRIRVGLAGPGKAFGYEPLIDGLPSPVTAITRERSLLLVLPRGPFEQLFHREDAISRVFLDVIQRDLVATLRQSLRPHARLAASV